MRDSEPIVLRPARGRDGSSAHRRTGLGQKTLSTISFNRRELDQILDVYGRKVADGEWRDYAIDMLREKAVFSIFRRTTETPLFRIEKHPRLSRKQGAYSVIAPTGLIMKRGHDLTKVLRVLDRKLKLVEA